MPRSPLHTITWSEEHSLYELSIRASKEYYSSPNADTTWLTWLESVTSFAFQGKHGTLNMYRESRQRGGPYWYAYYTHEHRTHKRYLGQSARVTLARLEEIARTLTREYASPPESTPMGNVSRDSPSAPDLLPLTRLVPPRPPGWLVRRKRLSALMNTIPGHRLTVISASAGWGKTTLLSWWATNASFAIAWLSLDESDNDPTRFWASVIAALQTHVPTLGATALAMLRSPEPPTLSLMLTTLMNDLRHLNSDTLLIFDDYHLITEDTLHESTRFFLEHLPEHLHLVISSRVDPPLRLSHWRAKGQLLEIRDNDLRFHKAEAASFLTEAIGLQLSDQEVVRLTERTEGWIAGLHLGALAYQQGGNSPAFFLHFGGTHRYLLDYIQEDILAHQPAELQTFLLHTSILSRVSAAVCQAVTAAPSIQASQEMLAELERANLFLVPLDDERRWYRFHELFREALLARLRSTQPEMEANLHRRAARWYETQGDRHEAIAHALAANDFIFAATLIEQIAEQMWSSGDITLLYRWLAAFPDAILNTYASLVLTTSLHLLWTTSQLPRERWQQTHPEVEQMLTRVEEAWKQPDPARSLTEEKLLRKHLHLLRIFIEAQEAIHHPDTFHTFAARITALDLPEDEDMTWNLISLTLTLLFHGVPFSNGNALVPKLLRAKQHAPQAKDRYVSVKVIQWLAHVYLRSGQLELAYRESLEALALAKHMDGHFSSVRFLQYYLAYILYRRNHLDEARRFLSTMHRYALDWQHIDLAINGYELWMQIALAEKDVSHAWRIMEEMEQFAQRQEQIPYPADIVLTGIRVRFWLATENLALAGDWATHFAHQQRNASPMVSPEEYQLLHLLVQVHLAQKRFTLALETLDRVLGMAEADQQREYISLFLALQVIALVQKGEQEQARAVALRLLTLAKAENALRLYLDAGESMRQIIQSLLSAPSAQDQDQPIVSAFDLTQILAAFAQERRRARRGEKNHLPSQTTRIATNAKGTALPLLEPLSPQEQRVLCLLTTGRSNQEIANELIVSINTIRTHIQSIYQKLGVHNRLAASEAARQWHLCS